MTDLALQKLWARQQLQRRIEAGHNLEAANREKRREWIAKNIYKGADSQQPDKFGESRNLAPKVAAE